MSLFEVMKEDGMRPQDMDWGQMWRKRQEDRRAADDKEFWNGRAPSFSKVAGTSPYAREFLEKAAIAPGETVFDMGCGSGTLALPLAKAGNEIWGADFSPVMLELMMRQAEIDGVSEGVHPIEASWADDWDNAGIPLCDVAIASRSIATNDMEESLRKLESKARRKVCLTVSNGFSPRVDPVIFNILGRTLDDVPEYVYAMNILWQMGRAPELSFIHSVRNSVYDSREHAIEKTCDIMDLTDEEQAKLEAYIDGHLHPAVTEEGEGWAFDHVRTIDWAFISWNV